MLKQHICHFEIDRKMYKDEALSLHVVFKQHSGHWKSGWIFEAISIEFKDFACFPPINRTQNIIANNVPIFTK